MSTSWNSETELKNIIINKENYNFHIARATHFFDKISDKVLFKSTRGDGEIEIGGLRISTNIR